MRRDQSDERDYACIAYDAAHNQRQDHKTDETIAGSIQTQALGVVVAQSENVELVRRENEEDRTDKSRHQHQRDTGPYGILEGSYLPQIRPLEVVGIRRDHHQRRQCAEHVA